MKSTSSQSEPICIRGENYRQRKTFTYGTHRSADPSNTLQVIRPLLNTAGITRLADITGLDKIGVPVVLCVRPNSKSISCSAGKGLTLSATTVSAAMEGIELHAAEELVPDIYFKTYSQITRLHDTIEWDHLPLSKHSLLHRDMPIDWVLGWDILSQREVAVPFSLVSMSNYRNPYDLKSFQTSSNGLASGNNILEACSSALFEIIERDSVTCFRSKHHDPLAGVIDPVSIPYDTVTELLSMFSSADLCPIIRDCTSNLNIPTFEVQLFDKEDPDAGSYGGYGCHLSAEIALIRAITEAAQSRTVTVAGSRDDFFREHFRMTKYLQGQMARTMMSAVPTGQLHNHVETSGECFEDDLHYILDTLVGAGIRQVVVIQLPTISSGLAIVKALVPGLEGPTIFGYTPGIRLGGHS